MVSHPNKADQKNQRRIAKQSQHKQQQKRMRALLLITGVVVVAVIIVAIALRPTTTSEFAYDDLPRLGADNAPVKIVEFGDFKCPACKMFSEQMVPQLKSEYIDTGIASLYFMNFAFIGPDSFTAAAAGRSIFHQNNDAFWKFYDAIYKNQPNEKVIWATTEYLADIATKENLGINIDTLKQDIESGKYDSEVTKHNNKAKSLVVQSTPTLFINGKKFDNVFDYAAIKKAIEEARKGEQS